MVSSLSTKADSPNARALAIKMAKSVRTEGKIISYFLLLQHSYNNSHVTVVVKLKDQN